MRRHRPLVFAQMLAGFEIAGADPRVVSVTLVQPEDDPASVRDFTLHMSMLDFLHRLHPRVPISLHAGELTGGLVPTEVLRTHIRQSVETGHALRIGHGVDLIDESEPLALLRQLAEKRVLIEVSLTSNHFILGVRGKRHPLRLYLRSGVPVALATDDLGVSRSSHTGEFERAVEDQGLDYSTLKRVVRSSLEHAFVDGTTKLRLRSELEQAFRRFERQVSGAPNPAAAR
jgi:adenosine deaminase